MTFLKIYLFKIRNLFFIASIWFLIATIRGAYISGITNNTTLFLAAITVAVFCYGLLFDKLIKLKWLNILTVSVIAIGLVTCIAIAIYGNRTTATFDEGVVIVLGAGILFDEPRPTLARRLDAAVSYHQQNPNALIIVSGGLGHRETYTEAYVMANYLIANGVPPERILLEDIAYSTYSNMRYSAEIINALFDEPPTVVVITSDFHMYRSVRFARQVGLEATIYPAATPWRAMPLAYVREIASIIKMWILGT